MVAVKTGMIAPPSMPQNVMPPPMPVPPMGQQMMPPQQMPTQQGTAPVAPIMRSNAGRRRRFGDRLESMLASNQPPVASDQMAGMNVFTGQMPRRQMPRSQMMGGTAMQPPVRRMMGGGAVPIPRETDIYGQPHMLAYIRPEEADLLKGLGGMGTPGPGGVPQYGWFSDTIAEIFSGGAAETETYNSPSSSSSSSSSGPGFDPSAPPDSGGYYDNSSSTTSTNILDTPSQDTAKANEQYANTMIAGGGGTNLSGSGSTAMDKLLADQQAQTQNDSSSTSNKGTENFSTIKRLEEERKQREAEQERIRLANKKFIEDQAAAKAEADALAAQAAAEAAVGLDPFGGAGPDITPTTNTGVIGGYDTIGTGSIDDTLGGIGDASNIDIFTTADVVPIGDPSDASNIDLLNTGTPIVGDVEDATNILDLTPPEDPPLQQVYYDMFGNPYKTQAEANAADAEHLRKQQAAADAEAEKQRAQAAAEEAARIQAEAAAAEAERIRIAQQAAAEAEMGLDPFGGTGGPDNPLYVSDVFETPDPMTMQESSFDYGTDPINTGLGDTSLNPPERPEGGGEEEDDRGFLKKLVDDITAVPGNIASDFQMALDAGLLTGLLGGYPAMREKLRKVYNPDGSRKYTDAEIDDYIQRTKDKQALDKKNAEEASKNKSTTEDGTVGGVGEVVDPCPTGFKLDPASGICVPVDDTEEDEDSGDDKEEDTSDDELSGVVVTPPPPTSYLDNPIRMNRGGSVGLNRAADNFLAAMGA